MLMNFTMRGMNLKMKRIVNSNIKRYETDKSNTDFRGFGTL